MNRIQRLLRNGPAPTLADVTGLGRPLDPLLPSNRLAIIGTVIAGLVMAVRDLNGPGSVDVMSAFSTALAVFLAWAIGRELDPDDPRAAGVAMAVTLVFGLTIGVEAAAAAVVLLGIRLIVGSVGRPLKPVDYALLIGVAGFAGTSPELWAPAALVVIALLVARPAGFRIAAITATTVAGVSALAWSPPVALNISLPALAVVAFAVLSVFSALPSTNVTSWTDSGDQPISTHRVALARVVTGVTIALSIFLATGSLPTVAPILGSLVSVAFLVPFGDRWPRVRR